MAANWRRARVLLLCGGLTVGVIMGVRHTFGLFLPPMTESLGWGRETFALALAIQNIVWGLSQPFVGMIADRFGAGKVVFTGALLYGLGVVLMGHSGSGAELNLTAGLLVGLGLSGSTFSVVFGAISRATPPEKRTVALTLTSTAGSLGQFVMVPASQALVGEIGWLAALMVLGLLAAAMSPLAVALAEPDRRHEPGRSRQTLREAMREAFGTRAFWLLTLGFFVCGFQVVFVGVHLPAFLSDSGFAPVVAVTSLALVGLFNILGTFCFGMLAARRSKKNLLAVLYIGRAAVITLYLVFPLSTVSTYLFAAALGILWLSTVPLTNALVAQIFGVKHMSMLSGFVFLSHQCGSFLGAWLGGALYDATGSYTVVWIIAIGLGVMAALINLPIDERPLATEGGRLARAGR